METSDQRIVRGAAFLAVALLGFASACVPATRYEEAKTALQSEQNDNRLTHARAAELEHALQEAQATIRAEEQRLDDHEKQLADSNLDAEQVASARDNALGMVEQLRGELARASDHLRAYSAEKDELSKALAAAAANHPKAVEVNLTASNASIIRDVTLAFHEDLSAGRYELAFADGRAVLVLPPTSVASGRHADKRAKELVRHLAEFLALHTDVRLFLTAERGNQKIAAKELGLLREHLLSAGVAADRVQVPEAPAPTTPAEGPALLRVQFLPAN